MGRLDLFTIIHKAIRAMIYDLGKKLLQTDFTDNKSVQEIIARLQHDTEMLSEHGEHEEQFVFPELKQHEPSLIDLFLKEHFLIEERIKKINSLIEKLEFIKDEDIRNDMGENLNRAFNDLASTYLTHMHHEETTLLPTTWEHFTDEQLGAMRANIQRNMPPERYAEWLHWIFGGANNTEIITMLKGVKTIAPQPLLSNLIEVAEKTLSKDRWERIKKAAEL